MAFGLLLALLPLSSANAAVGPFTLVQTIQTSQFSPASPDPAGLAYMPGPDRLMVSDSEVEEMAIFQGVNLYQVTRTGSLADTGVTTAFSKEPTGLGFNPATNTLFVSDDQKDRVFLIQPGADGRHGTGDDTRTSISTAAFGAADPEGIEFDTGSGHLFVSDGADREVYEVSPGANGTFDGVPPSGDDVVTHFDVGALGIVDPEGIGVDTARDTLVISDRGSRDVFEVSKSGLLVQRVDTSTIPGIRSPSGVTVAPASNDPASTSWWVVDRGVDNDSNPNENDGKIYELSVTADPPPDVTITAPDEGATVSGTVTIEASAADFPGPVTQVEFFVDGTSLGADTSAPYSATWDTTTAAEGSHTLTATATAASGQTASDSNSVTVDNVGGSTLDVAIGAGADDVEERPDGRMRLANNDLELVTDTDVGEVQTVGLRFTGIGVPAGATILDAYVQFRADEQSSVATNLTVGGEASDNAPPFTTAKFNVSSRPDTTASVPWAPPAWALGQAGSAQRTPDLSAVVQEIVSRPGWGPGNALALVITGSGRRVAEPFEGGFPAVLHIEYTTG